MNTLEFCAKYLTNYIINSDGTIDVDGNVDLYNKFGDMTKLPVKFRKISGNFDCGYNKLTTLEGCPKYVGGYFNCHSNKLSTLEGCPIYVGGYFNCHSNKLSTLEGCPIYVGGDFACDNLTYHILGNVQGKKIYYNKQRIVI